MLLKLSSAWWMGVAYLGVDYLNADVLGSRSRKVARKADREGGHPGELTFNPSRPRV